MQEKIEDILKELYELDPELAGHEATLKEFLLKFLANQPHPVVNREFASKLRRELLAKAESMRGMNETTSFGKLKVFSFSMALVALAAVVTSGVLYDRAYGPVSFLGFGSGDVSKVVELAPNAFGTLGQVSTARGIGGGGGGEGAKLAQGGGGGDASLVPAYRVYDFKYEGDVVIDLPSEALVYRKTKDSLRGQVAGFLSRFRLSDFGLKNFTKNQIDMITVSDDVDSGYSVNIDFMNNNMSLYPNYNRWSTAEKQCMWDPECIKQKRAGQTEATQSEILQIAKNFVAEYGINTQDLGEPQIHESWVQTLELMRIDPSFLTTDATVVFPRLIENGEVRDEGGNTSGLLVSVNVWDRVVTNANDIWAGGLEKSGYTGETNFERLKGLAEKGSYMGFEPYFDPSAELVTVKLGTPTKGLLRTWQTMPNTGETTELYVEALFFPVLNQQDTGYWSKSIAIPLVKDILDNQPKPPVTIMPAK